MEEAVKIIISLGKEFQGIEKIFSLLFIVET